MQLTILSYIIMNTGEEERGRTVENAIEYIELEAHSEVTSTSIEEWFSHYGERLQFSRWKLPMRTSQASG